MSKQSAALSALAASEGERADRLADLRQRRRELVDVLAQTLLQLVLSGAPRAGSAAACSSEETSDD